MSREDYPAAFLERLKTITAKRPKAVIDHILEHGFVTTEALESQYGYKHPPRAARDVREQGIPLETFRVKDAAGRTIAAYRFGDLSKVRYDRLGGRAVFSKTFRINLIRQYGSRCAICGTLYEDRYFQVDHRVPYEVSGNVEDKPEAIGRYMPLGQSCNRAKSWSCEHCQNWIVDKSPQVCQSCYWGSPEAYKHIALRDIRRLDITWSEGEIDTYYRLKTDADAVNEPVSDYVKLLLKKYLSENDLP